MRSQLKSYSCGAAALVNAGRALGKKFSEGKVRKLAGTTEDGTDEVGLIAAARGLGLSATPNWTSDRNAAWSFVRANVLDGRPCLVCIDNWGHWATVIGIVGDRVLLMDPSNSKRNMDELGVHSMSRTELLKRWKHRTQEEPFYAIAVGK